MTPDDKGIGIAPPKPGTDSSGYQPIFIKKRRTTCSDWGRSSDLIGNLRKLGVVGQIWWLWTSNLQVPSLMNTNLKGAPLRTAIGPKVILKMELEAAVTRYVHKKESVSKSIWTADYLERTASTKLAESVHESIRLSWIPYTEVNTFDEFKDLLWNQSGGFFIGPLGWNPKTEETIKELTKSTIRCGPLWFC